MDKQEAIEQINYIDTLNINDMIAGQQVDMVIKNQVLDIINQIDEPQKVTIPKFVAEWIERCKESKDTLYHALQDNDDVNDWLDRDDNEDLFARAWLDGYEVEQEKLYTVEIPNPNFDEYRNRFVLGRMDGKVCIKQVSSTTWEMNCSNQLTESEIKKDFAWAWEWAKPV